MTRLQWVDRPFDLGISQGVYYGSFVSVWNGLTAVEENEDSTFRVLFADGRKIRSSLRPNDLSGTISAFNVPRGFIDEHTIDPQTGSIRTSEEFNLSYRSNNVLHLWYNVRLVAESISRVTLNVEVEATEFSWSFTTRPVSIPGNKPAAHFYLDLTSMREEDLSDLEALLYGNQELDPYFPSIDELIQFIDSRAVLLIADHGDGTWSAIGPDGMFEIEDDWFSITTPSAYFIDESHTTYTISSY